MSLLTANPFSPPEARVTYTDHPFLELDFWIALAILGYMHVLSLSFAFLLGREIVFL